MVAVVSGDEDQMWSRPGDEADDQPRVLANHVRALQREVRSGFEIITQKVLDRLDRFDARLDVVIDRQNEADRSLADLRQAQARTEARLTALETKRRKSAARKK